jgi:hypothetical protein
MLEFSGRTQVNQETNQCLNNTQQYNSNFAMDIECYSPNHINLLSPPYFPTANI